MLYKVTPGEDIEIVGIWWIPGRARNKVKGTLTLSAVNGGTLRLSGALPGPNGKREIFFPEFIHPEVINGKAVNGDLLTLFDCHETYNNMGLESAILAYTVVNGASFKSYARAKFNKITVVYSDISDWLQLKTVKAERNEESGSYNIVSSDNIDRDYKNLKPHNISLHSYSHIKELTFPQTVFTMIQRGSVSIIPENPETIAELWHSVQKIRKLICLGLQKPVYVDYISADSPKGKRKSKRGETYHKVIEVYKRQMTRIETQDPNRSTHILYSYPQVEEYFDTMLDNLSTKYEMIKPLLDNHTAWYYVEKGYQEPRFLLSVISIEQFMRKMHPRNRLPRQDHRERKKEVLTAINNRHKAWVTEALQYSNEVSLKDRIEDMLNQYRNVFIGYFLFEKFAKRVAEIRNYLVHGSKRRNMIVPTSVELYELTIALEAIAEGCILCELGLPQNIARKLLHDCKGWQLLNRTNKEI